MIETDRLLLRAWRAADSEPFAALNADPEVARFLGGPLSRPSSDELIARIRKHWEDHGFGLWAAELKETGELTGFVGLAIPSFLPEVLPAVEVGWRLGRAFWGRGLATEGARASIEHAFGPLGLEQVVSIIDPDNAASLRVAEKLGMTPGRDRIHPQTRRRLKVMEIRREALQ